MSGHGNGYGSYLTSRAADMAAHDAAPPLLRWALNYAVGSWAAELALEAWRSGVPESEIIANMIRRGRRDTIEAYGPSHPEAAID